MGKLPTDADYKKMARAAAAILKPNEKALSDIDGLITAGVGIARRDWKRVVITFMISNKTDGNQRSEIIDTILALPEFTEDNTEFDVEPLLSKRHTAYEGERIRPDRPK